MLSQVLAITVPMIQFDPAATVIAGTGLGLLVTGLLLGFRHGFDWDHIAAITDITSTTATADAGTEIHERAHELTPHEHLHGGQSEASAHGEPAAGASASAMAAPALSRELVLGQQRHAILLGTLYA